MIFAATCGAPTEGAENDLTNPPTILVTGATGSYGSEFCQMMLTETDAKLRAYSRGEHRQAALADALRTPARVTYIIGDVRDRAHLTQAAHGCTHIVHAAALKIAPNSHIHPREFKKTNVDGSMNVVDAAIANGVPRTLLVSSDKSCAAYSPYGRGKGLAEDDFVAANHLGVTMGSRFCAARGGNVWGSNGSVMRRWKVACEEGWPLIVNHPDTTRFHLPMDEWLAFCWRAVNEQHGGEIFIPKARAWRLGDLAEAYANPAGLNVQPLRTADKPYEWLYSRDEAHRVKDIQWAFVLEPPEELRQVWNYKPWCGAAVTPGTAYSSDSAPRLSVDDLRVLVGELG